MAIETSSGARLIEAHVERFNAGVRSGDAVSVMVVTYASH